MATIRGKWLTRYADEKRTTFIAREWLGKPSVHDGETETPVAEWSDGPVTDPENWKVIGENEGSWLGGQFVVNSSVERL